jgi:hypothetical protein
MQKATIIFVLSVSPSFRMEQLGSNWTVLNKIWYLIISRKTVQAIKVPLKFDKNNR